MGIQAAEWCCGSPHCGRGQVAHSAHHTWAPCLSARPLVLHAGHPRLISDPGLLGLLFLLLRQLSRRGQGRNNSEGLRSHCSFCSLQFVDIGIVTSIEVNHKQVDVAKKGQEVCVKIEPIPGESPKMYGRHFEATDILVSKVSHSLSS